LVTPTISMDKVTEEIATTIKIVLEFSVVE
jgi:hypothetical protein